MSQPVVWQGWLRALAECLHPLQPGSDWSNFTSGVVVATVVIEWFGFQFRSIGFLLPLNNSTIPLPNASPTSM